MTNGKASVVFDFFCRIVHAYIIGNDDMHLKNISLQKLQNNTSLYYDRLTPGYDILFTQAFDNTTRSDVLALDLLDDEKNLSPPLSTLPWRNKHAQEILR